MPINPVVFTLGGVQIHAFTAAIVLVVALGVGWLLGTAHRLHQPLIRWLDAATGAVVGGVIGARALHVILESTYFGAHPDQILVLSAGGFDWHGAIFGGLIGCVFVAKIRNVPFTELADALALIVPLGAIGVWSGCSAAACAYGVEVPTLADYPSWLVVESPDVYGSVAPRLNLPQIGMFIGIAVFLLILALSVTRRARGLRLWIALSAVSLATAPLEFFRGDYVVTWFDHRADQVLDLAVLLLATLAAAATLVMRTNKNERNRRTGAAIPENRGRDCESGKAFDAAPGSEKAGR
jgi:phosphatidylglycerol:prolipoprotein diacylglycerol transferase